MSSFHILNIEIKHGFGIIISLCDFLCESSRVFQRNVFICMKSMESIFEIETQAMKYI